MPERFIKGENMDRSKIVITVRIPKKKVEQDLEVPTNITANDLVVALNTIYELGMDINNIADCFLKAENPIALLKGNRTLEEFGMHNGSLIIINE